MECVVQLRAGKLFAADLSGNIVRHLEGVKFLIAGDVIQINEVGILFRRRSPRYALANVRGFDRDGVLLDYPEYLHFQTIVPIRDRVRAGDRVLVHLSADGLVHYIRSFPNIPSEDLTCALAQYNLINTEVVFDAGTRAAPKYTQGHTDLTHLETFTVDPASSIDRDDAISLDPVRRKIYVHIVDIHTVVPHGAPVEELMFRYGSTLYLAEHTQHLLPYTAIAASSLDAGVKRSAITVEMTLDADWNISEFGIYPSTIIVKHMYTYEEFDVKKSCAPYNYLMEFAEKHAATLPLNIPGLLLDVGNDGLLRRVDYSYSDDAAHRMIACAMIATNFTVSAHLSSLGVVLPNRFHEAPTGIFQSDVRSVTGHPIVDSYISVKKWRPAHYDLEKKGHFGLGLREYVHFTSPMRRYPDVLIHRILAGINYRPELLTEMVNAINERAGRVRAIQKWYNSVKIARYLHQSTGRLVSVYITSVNRSGVSWYSPEYLINGYTHVSLIGAGARWDFMDEKLFWRDRIIAVGSVCAVNDIVYDFTAGSYRLSLV
jgi:exoribonuclease R